VVITNAKTTGGGAAIHDKEYMNGTSPVKKPLTILERMFSSPILRLGEQQLEPTIIFRLMCHLPVQPSGHPQDRSPLLSYIRYMLFSLVSIHQTKRLPMGQNMAGRLVDDKKREINEETPKSISET